MAQSNTTLESIDDGVDDRWRRARETSDALDAPAVRQRFADLGLRVARPEERMPEYLTQLVSAEIAKWAKPIKTSGVSMD